jgi:uncharacterized membrane protein YcjF (UPF0283 family)
VTNHLHYHQLYDPEVHHMNRPLTNYWKGILATLGAVVLAVQQWVGDTGTSHYTQADWVRLAIAVVTAALVVAKANTGTTGAGGV